MSERREPPARSGSKAGLRSDGKRLAREFAGTWSRMGRIERALALSVLTLGLLLGYMDFGPSSGGNDAERRELELLRQRMNRKVSAAHRDQG